ncbi:RagB/SusD family nutrient uptake outer membrane protein [Chitinophaga ginsengisoli]|uniref:SusD-like starch-binding protein associating with outer membrane n=1 Tax=Chitinophaga ginsengisoli TaxID=363837 RepID=A0A2P8G287_9BACT|nr:RagB/SusD family nutrient uptake outer membrane protein [Chitinophaga ginsengisoli]PSL28094.1 SusD-like starch-binding protein associating with outer membrane [Chitinophaga ginsengisoli]
MAIQKYLHLIVLYSICVCGTACKKLVEVAPPKTQLVTTNVFENNSTATAALTSIYGQISSLSDLSWLTGMSSDEFLNYSTTQSCINVYGNSLIESDASLLSNFSWNPQYQFIYQANAVIEGLQRSTGVSDQIKNQLRGEALFIRALMHFYLANLYGPIPVVTTTDYSNNLKLSKTNVADVYKFIITDLTESVDLLSDNFVNAANNPTTDRVRPTKWAAYALLARVYLHNKDYANAKIQATKVIDNSITFMIVKDLNSVFTMNSQETIWSIMPPPGRGYDTDEARKYILTSAPNQTTGVSLSYLLLSSFEPGDKRMNSWVGEYVDNTSNVTYCFPYKYKILTDASISEYSIVLRLAEQYLIRAEAEAQLEEFANSVADINVIRARAGLSDLPIMSKQDLLNSVLHERQIELFSEGFRWFDLKRRDDFELLMNKIAVKKGVVWNDYQQLYPIPASDVKSSNIVQNNGY